VGKLVFKFQKLSGVSGASYIKNGHRIPIPCNLYTWSRFSVIVHSSVEAWGRLLNIPLQMWWRGIESCLLDEPPWADPTAWINIFTLWGGRCRLL
jgi:hypothetical protein